MSTIVDIQGLEITDSRNAARFCGRGAFPILHQD
jgi:hypothetical protein